tara:strand:- start:71 stop:247 length:177 start_codon:yes stop_codon:yes gene_type:complete
MKLKPTKIFEEEITKEMNWLGTIIIILALFFVILFSFTLLVVANAILADVEILNFIHK